MNRINFDGAHKRLQGRHRDSEMLFDNGPRYTGLGYMAVIVREKRPTAGGYVRHRMEDMPLFDPAYINPGRAITDPSQMASAELRRRLQYMKQPGALGESVSEEEQQRIKAELRRRRE